MRRISMRYDRLEFVTGLSSWDFSLPVITGSGEFGF